jgi:hypothetical protein
MLYLWQRRGEDDGGKGGSYNGVDAALLLCLRERNVVDHSSLVF